MSHADSQQLAEVIDVADFSVRTASELRLVNAGRTLRDEEALLRAVECLRNAIAGGVLMSTGKSLGLHSTLRPLNWTADTFFSRSQNDPAVSRNETDYDQLSNFLKSRLATLESVLNDNKPLDATELDNTSEFFQNLGDVLALRANQMMRPSSRLNISDNLLVPNG